MGEKEPEPKNCVDCVNFRGFHERIKPSRVFGRCPTREGIIRSDLAARECSDFSTKPVEPSLSRAA